MHTKYHLREKSIHDLFNSFICSYSKTGSRTMGELFYVILTAIGIQPSIAKPISFKKKSYTTKRNNCESIVHKDSRDKKVLGEKKMKINITSLEECKCI